MIFFVLGIWPVTLSDIGGWVLKLLAGIHISRGCAYDTLLMFCLFFFNWLVCHYLLLLKSLWGDLDLRRFLYLALLLWWGQLLFYFRWICIMDGIQIQRSGFTVCTILLSVEIHFVSYLLLDVLQNLSIDKLREWIQLFLVKQCHKVIAKPPHFAFTMKQRILQDSSSRAIDILLGLHIFLNPKLLCRSFGVGPLSDCFLKKHQYKRADIIPWRHGILRAMSKQDRNLVAFEHDVWEKEFKAILQFEFSAGVSIGIILLLEWLFIYAHVWSLNNPNGLS